MLNKKVIFSICLSLLPIIGFSQEVLANTSVEANNQLKIKKAEQIAKSEQKSVAPPVSVPASQTEEKVQEKEEVKIASGQDIALTTEDLDPQTKFDIESIKAFLTSFNESVAKNDGDKIVEFFNDKFIVVRSDQTAFNNKEALSKYFFESSGSGKEAKLLGVLLEDKVNVVFSRNIQNAAVVGKGLETYKINGSDVELPIRWTATLEKVDGAWKINNFHFAANHLDNKILSTYESSAKKFGLFGLFAGIVCGLIILSLLMLLVKFKRK